MPFQLAPISLTLKLDAFFPEFLSFLVHINLFFRIVSYRIVSFRSHCTYLEQSATAMSFHFRTIRIAVFRCLLKTHLFNISDPFPSDFSVPAQ